MAYLASEITMNISRKGTKLMTLVHFLFLATQSVAANWNDHVKPVCPSGSSSCRARMWGYNVCATGSRCNVCAECCHDEIGKNQTLCDACTHKQCPAGSYGDYGCRKLNTTKCCPGGQPNVSKTLPNCLLIGDSVAHGTFGLVREKLKDVCVVSNIESVTSGAEDACFWSTVTSAATGLPVKWAVIHYNEGLHSLWPRVNTSAERAQWAADLGNFTEHLKAVPGAQLIYATMTPFMPEKFLNPDRPGPFNPQNDVEDKNALAVATVKAHGVTLIDDLYSAVTAICGKVYRNCSLCDDESRYHPGVQCGYHYSSEGWELLATQTAKHISEALALGPHPPWPPRPSAPPHPTSAPPHPPIPCSNQSEGWGHNVTCPPQSEGCVARQIYSPRNGFPWACRMPSLSTPGSISTCATGAPYPLSTSKKNVLIIGDSVSNGYFLEGVAGSNVPDLLQDVALVQHAPFSPGSGGAGPTSHGLDCMDVYLRLANGEAADYDVITFNFGLHDLGNTSADLSTYTTQLSAIADRLLQTKAKLLYIYTTPMMPACCDGAPLIPSSEGAPPPKCKRGAEAIYSCDSVVQRLNQAAQELMASRKIPTLDLHKVVTDVCAPKPPHRYVNCSICRMQPCSFHYNPEGYKMLSQPIASALRKLL